MTMVHTPSGRTLKLETPKQFLDIVRSKAQYACGILASIVNALHMSPDTEVEGISTDHVPAAPPKGESPAGKKRAIVVVYCRSFDAIEKDAILTAPHSNVADGDMGRSLDTHRAAVFFPPFPIIVVMREKPVSAVLGGRSRFQVLPVVVRIITAPDLQPIGESRDQSILEAVNPGILDDNASVTINANPNAREFIPRPVWRSTTKDRSTLEAHRDIVRGDVEHTVAIPVFDHGARQDLDNARLGNDRVISSDNDRGKKPRVRRRKPASEACHQQQAHWKSDEPQHEESLHSWKCDWVKALSSAKEPVTN